MSVLTSTILNVPLPAIARDLHVSIAAASLLITTQAITFATFLPLADWVGNRFGRRNMYCIAIAAYGLAALVGSICAEPRPARRNTHRSRTGGCHDRAPRDDAVGRPVRSQRASVRTECVGYGEQRGTSLRAAPRRRTHQPVRMARDFRTHDRHCRVCVCRGLALPPRRHSAHAAVGMARRGHPDAGRAVVAQRIHRLTATRRAFAGSGPSRARRLRVRCFVRVDHSRRGASVRFAASLP